MKLYGVINPSGNLQQICHSSWDAKTAIFDSQNQEFRSKFWHKAEPAWNAAKKLGWKIEIGKYEGSGKFIRA